ncbi:L-lysine-aminomutase [Xylariales sp. PMI_506]|nr:L-lysine-aminomutase [Xylariales sp. PMI_506]
MAVALIHSVRRASCTFRGSLKARDHSAFLDYPRQLGLNGLNGVRCSVVGSHQGISRRSISTTAVRHAQEVQIPRTSPGTPIVAPINTEDVVGEEFWRQIPMWKDISAAQFMSWSWNTKNVVEHHTRSKPQVLHDILVSLVPEVIPYDKTSGKMQNRHEFIEDVFAGISCATMSLRIMPHIFSRINWKDPRSDPIFRQFIPLKSVLLEDHPACKLDSLHEKNDSVVDGLVHRYPDKALFLPISVCPTYCAFCTRSWGVGADTDTLEKAGLFKPIRQRWERCLQYIENTPQLTDIVVSGGDAYYLGPNHLAEIGDRLIKIPHIKKFRFASKGLAVCPNRILDPNDSWTNALIYVSQQAEKAGKRVALHTHFNHPNEISWVTEKAAQRLRDAGVTVRNQTVLLRRVNDDVETMGRLIRTLADTLRIAPYYVYQCDMVPKAEHFRTPLQTILDLQTQLRGFIAGFDMPQFVVDLPGGGGKRLACDFKSYDRVTGVSRFVAPAIKGQSLDSNENKIYEYHDPIGYSPLPSE